MCLFGVSFPYGELSLVAPDGRLDGAAVNLMFHEGELEPLADRLEAYLKVTPESNEEDRLIAYKFLGIIHSSRPESRLKGESYFYQMLKIAPNIELVQPYVSDRIQEVFQNVKKEYHKREALTKLHDELGRPIELSDSISEPVDKKKGKRRIWALVGAGAGLATAGGVVAWYMTSDRGNKKADPQIIEVEP